MDKLNKDERELLDSFESGEWNSLSDVKPESDRLTAIAKTTIQKKKRINIRLSESDLNRIRIKAVEEGIPYQTLISSILHKYASGKLEI